MLSIDLVLSLTNPFTNYTRNRARYVLSAFVIAAAAAGSLLGLSAEKLGNTHFRFCWFVPETRDAGINKFLWAYFYTPSLAVYLFSIGVLLYAFYRLRRGMRDTYEVRQEVFRRGRNYVLGFVIYWVLAESLYFASLAGQEREAVGTLSVVAHAALQFCVCVQGRRESRDMDDDMCVLGGVRARRPTRRRA